MDSIRIRQWSKLKALLDFANKNVPYYTKLFKKLSIFPGDIKNAEGLKKIPILTKRDIIDNFDKLLSKDINRRKVYLNSSGGSTGVNLNFYQDNFYQEKRASSVYWGNELAGWRLGEPTAYLWGIDDDRLSSQKDKLNRFLKNEIILNTFNVSEDEMLAFYRKLLRFKVRFIIGYASSLYFFFKVLKMNGLTLPTLRSVISSAEVLYDHQRAFLEKECGIEVFDRYGSREVGLIASECSAHDGMHIYTDNVYVESVKYAGTDTGGEIIVTSLINYVMPFIRYRIEDIGVLDEGACACGRNLPKVKTITGRSSSIFTTRDRKYIHGEYFTHLFYGIKEIEKFQFVQKDEEHYILKVVPGKGFNDSILTFVEKKIKNILGDVDIDRKIVDSIEPSKSGKHVFTFSEMKINV